MIRHVEPTVITTPGGEEVFVLTLTKSEWESLRQELKPQKFKIKQPASQKRKLPNPVKLEGTLTASDYVQAARD